jgi:hypothetical protein
MVLTCAVLLVMPAALMAVSHFWAQRNAATAPAGSAAIGEAVFFQFDYPPAPETFVFQVHDPALIATARAGIAAGIDDLHVMGTIRTTPVPYNPPWSYHLDPVSIRFFNVAIEVCDASIAYVEANLDQVGGAFLPGATWCPWGSRLLKEVGTVPPPLSPTPPPAEPLFQLYLPLIGA